MKAEFVSLRKKYLENKFKNLNNMQVKAVLTTEGPVLILAGAGSGKTTVLVHRVANLVAYGRAYQSDEVYGTVTQEDIDALSDAINFGDPLPEETLAKMSVSRVQPYNILAITFTNKAAGELRERLIKMIGPGAEEIAASTFHSACVRILRRYIDRLGFNSNFTIYDVDDAQRMIKNILKNMNLDDQMFKPKALHHKIGRLKDSMVSPEEYTKEAGSHYYDSIVAKVYVRYQQELKAANAVDFDDIIYYTVQLFKENPDVLAYYQNRYRYILVDEYQDTNRVQFELVRMLAEGHGNLCVVGDDDQSIYKFRGATIENILNFEGSFPGAMTIRLEQNYRSTQNILDAANQVIQNNKGRKGKSLWTGKGGGSKVTVHTAADEYGEAEYIGDTIVKLIREKGYRYNDFAVLYRMNAQSGAIERHFAKAGIPYKIVGGLRFFDRKEIKDLVAYLSVINNTNDTVRLKRIINEPKRGIGDATVAKAEEIANGLGISLYEVLQHAEDYPMLAGKKKALAGFTDLIDNLIVASQETTLPLLVRQVIDDCGYMDMLRAMGFEGESKIDNVQELVSSAAKYEEGSEEPSLQGYLEDIALITDLDNFDSEADAVVLMTMHAAKGLEFKNVFIPGMEDGIFPGKQSLFDVTELEEERRLCYVGITRAMENLYLLHTKHRMVFGQTQRNPVSRFVGELPQDQVDFTGLGETGSYQRVYTFEDEYTKKTKAVRGPSVGVKKPVSGKTSNSYQVGMRVSHLTFGQGTILSMMPMSGDTLLEIAFDTKGTKKVMANYAKLTIL
ncbi:MAG: UvrD-helicase domain-containing protein [Oscillospiraceae bacterium]|nr:UvrD-helicase domain-containing protein [Oscillospiraceae bacterium]